jgi:hypothetical protein
MSRIQELKNNTNHNLNLASILELFAPDGKSKYIEFTLRLMKNTANFKEHVKEVKEVLHKEFPFLEKNTLDSFSDFQLIFTYNFIHTFYNFEDIRSLRKFFEYNERGLVEQNDLSKYKTFDEMMASLNVADLKAEEKELESQVIKIYEDDTWVLVRPLTHLASKKYGANTKWCTTQENNTEYYNKYSKKGVLIYCTNKKTNYKVASFYSLDKQDPEFSYWNQKDTRIDSTESELTMELIGFIRDYVKNPKVKTNHFMFEGGSNKTLDSGKNKRTTAISDRVASAVRRAQEEIEVSEPEPQTENYDDMPVSPQMEVPESPIDRMQWASTTHTISETPTRLD